MSDDLKQAIVQLQRYVMAPAGAGFGLSKSAAHRLLNELSTHARRAALVAAWAEGLRAGKRYELPDRAGVTYSVVESEPRVCLIFAGGGHCETVDAELAAAYMLAVSDQWAEVE